jgi:hypothetical protein
MKSRALLLGLALTVLVSADTLTLRDGRRIEGTFMGGDARQIRMAVGDQIQNISVTDAVSIQFGSSPTAAITPQQPIVVTPQPSYTPAPVTQPQYGQTQSVQAQSGLMIPAGTQVVVRMIDGIDSDRDRVGQTFNASLDEPIVVNGQQVVPRGADVVARLVDDQKSGKISGRSQVTINLVSIAINGRPVIVSTANVVQASASRGKQSAGVIGGTSAIGAVIGAIAGGGRGAAIGAATGAGAGTAVQVITNGPTVKIPSETRLTFSLAQPVTI